MTEKKITVAGAGIAGLWQALRLAEAGHTVRLMEASATPFEACSSRWAGAMIAPECEAEAAPEIVRDLGRQSLALWRAAYPAVVENGTLVVAAVRDRSELTRFQRMTDNHQLLHATRLAELEPELAERFDAALYFPGEAHMDAIAALNALLAKARDAGVEVLLRTPWSRDDGDILIDCRGMAAREEIADLRGVRGERIVVRAKDVELQRPVRLLHPRQPIYVVPQGDGRFVIGATVIERDDEGPMTVKSALELLGSAFALHPGFAEAEIIDMGAGVRPAFPDHIPRIVIEDDGAIIRVNGMYRHGFLLAPVMASAVADFIATGKRSALMQDAVTA
ncbi:MAG: FAD-dependent oxidoreductase [Hyphomicrobium sp.]